MQNNINRLIGYKMKATDGEIGEVKEFYFDDETWAVRYLIIETGNSFSNKKMLIAPKSLKIPDWANKNFPVNLTKEQIRNSPDIDTVQPISHQQEIENYEYYAWQRYGGNSYYARHSLAAMNLSPVIEEAIINENNSANSDTGYDPYLRSTESVSGYYIHATDGEIGHLKDFIVDRDTWKIADLIIDTHNWIGGHKVLIPVRHVTEIQWENFKIILDISKVYLMGCPIFNEHGFVFPQNVFEL